MALRGLSSGILEFLELKPTNAHREFLPEALAAQYFVNWAEKSIFHPLKPVA
jgi:hypothetical protein